MGEVSPVIGDVKRTSGVAGQVAYTVDVTYPGGDTRAVTFIGSTYGAPGPIVMVLHNGSQHPVSEPDRFGETFGPEWVRAFWAPKLTPGDRVAGERNPFRGAGKRVPYVGTVTDVWRMAEDGIVADFATVTDDSGHTFPVNVSRARKIS